MPVQPFSRAPRRNGWNMKIDIRLWLLSIVCALNRTVLEVLLTSAYARRRSN
jgi:hypothetical protein